MATKLNHNRTADVVRELYSDILGQIDISEENWQCWIWTGYCQTKKKDEPARYGRIIKSINKIKHNYFVHQIVWLANQTPTKTVCPGDISHLCHNTKCVNPQHLVIEPSAINSQRKECKNQGSCKYNNDHFYVKNGVRHVGFKKCLL